LSLTGFGYALKVVIVLLLVAKGKPVLYLKTPPVEASVLKLDA